MKKYYDAMYKIFYEYQFTQPTAESLEGFSADETLRYKFQRRRELAAELEGVVKVAVCDREVEADTLEWNALLTLRQTLASLG